MKLSQVPSHIPVISLMGDLRSGLNPSLTGGVPQPRGEDNVLILSWEDEGADKRKRTSRGNRNCPQVFIFALRKEFLLD
jgi:hypothetical protein